MPSPSKLVRRTDQQGYTQTRPARRSRRERRAVPPHILQDRLFTTLDGQLQDSLIVRGAVQARREPLLLGIQDLHSDLELMIDFCGIDLESPTTVNDGVLPALA